MSKKDWFDKQFNDSIKVGTTSFELLRQLYNLANIAIRMPDPLKLMSLAVGSYEGKCRVITRVFDYIKDGCLVWSESIKEIMEKADAAH